MRLPYDSTRCDTALGTVPGAVRLIAARPAMATTRNSTQIPKPGGSRSRRLPLACQATSWEIIGKARITHMKSERPRTHQSG